jgi:hypothetical protein
LLFFFANTTPWLPASTGCDMHGNAVLCVSMLSCILNMARQRHVILLLLLLSVAHCSCTRPQAHYIIAACSSRFPAA